MEVPQMWENEISSPLFRIYIPKYEWRRSQTAMYDLLDVLDENDGFITSICL